MVDGIYDFVSGRRKANPSWMTELDGQNQGVVGDQPLVPFEASYIPTDYYSTAGGATQQEPDKAPTWIDPYFRSHGNPNMQFQAYGGGGKELVDFGTAQFIEPQFRGYVENWPIIGPQHWPYQNKALGDPHPQFRTQGDPHPQFRGYVQDIWNKQQQQRIPFQFK